MNLLLIHHYSLAISSLENQSTMKKITEVDYAVDHFVDAINRRVGCSPLFNRDYQRIFEIRSIYRKVLFGKNISSSFENF